MGGRAGHPGQRKLWHIPEEEAEAAMLKRRAPESNKDAQRQRKRREGGRQLWTDVGVRKMLRERQWERKA